MTKAPEFFFMESWGQKGRAAALAPDPNAAITMAGGIAGVGLIFLMVATWRFARRHRILARQEALAAQVEATRAAMAATYRSQGLAVPEALTMPLRPRPSRAKLVMGVLLVGVVASVGLAKLGHLDDAMFALPLLVVLLIILGVRHVIKTVAGGAARLVGAVAKASVPERPEPQSAPRYGQNFKPLGLAAPVSDTPLRVSDANRPAPPAIRSVSSLVGRLSTSSSAPGLIKWAPLAIGVVVMYASGKLFGGLGLSGQMGMEGAPVVQVVPKTPGAALPQLVDLGTASVEGMVVASLGIVAAMALLGLGLNRLVSRFSARRNIACANDPWARLERMTAAERARG